MAVVVASNAARDAFLRRLDPGAFAQPAAPRRAADADEGIPPPPPPSAGPVRRLREDYYGDSFFQLIAPLLPQAPDPALRSATTIDNLDYAGWFNYFLAEARAAKPSLEALGRIFCVLFDLSEALDRSGKTLALSPTFRFPAGLSPQFNRWLLFEPAALPLAVLTYLLELGFEHRLPVSAKAATLDTGEGNAVDPKVSHRFGVYFDLQSATNTQPIARETTPNYVIFYRGDSRDPATVVQHGGATCRADLDFWRKAAHVDEAWHPWKDAQKRGAMWIRKGNKDNDYFTVNSIGLDFHICCAYPILRLQEIDRTLTGHITDWTDKQRARLRATGHADFCLMDNKQTGEPEFVLWDKSWIYLCAFQEDALVSPTYVSPTYAQQSYPEAGVRNIDLRQIIAWFQIERYHNNDQLRQGKANAQACYASTAPGSTMTIMVRNWGWMNGAVGGKNTLALADTAAFEARMDSFRNAVFEIDHSRLLARDNTTYDPRRKVAAPNIWATVQPAKLKR